MSQDAARRFHFAPIALGLTALALTTGAAPEFQTVQEALLKAAFVNRFAKFTAWPAEALKPGGSLALCVINDKPVAESLRSLTTGQRVDGHEMVVRSESKAEALPIVTCHVLYVSRLNQKDWAAILVSIKGEPVLTVSDQDKFGENGGVVQLILENGGVAFAVNREAAKRARLQLAANFLELARFVKDGSHDN